MTPDQIAAKANAIFPNEWEIDEYNAYLQGYTDALAQITAAETAMSLMRTEMLEYATIRDENIELKNDIEHWKSEYMKLVKEKVKLKEAFEELLFVKYGSDEFQAKKGLETKAEWRKRAGLNPEILTDEN